MTPEKLFSVSIGLVILVSVATFSMLAGAIWMVVKILQHMGAL